MQQVTVDVTQTVVLALLFSCGQIAMAHIVARYVARKTIDLFAAEAVARVMQPMESGTRDRMISLHNSFTGIYGDQGRILREMATKHSEALKSVLDFLEEKRKQ